MNKVIKTVFIIALVIAIVFGGVAVIKTIKNDNAAPPEPEEIYVQVGEEKLYNDSNLQIIDRLTIITVNGLKSDYTVKFIRNEGKDFTFTVDGEDKSFAAEQADWTDVVTIKKGDGYITIRGGWTVKSLIEKLYVERNIALKNDFNPNEYYFRLEISDGSNTIKINVQDYFPVTSITLSPDHITF